MEDSIINRYVVFPNKLLSLKSTLVLPILNWSASRAVASKIWAVAFSGGHGSLIKWVARILYLCSPHTTTWLITNFYWRTVTFASLHQVVIVQMWWLLPRTVISYPIWHHYILSSTDNSSSKNRDWNPSKLFIKLRGFTKKNAVGPLPKLLLFLQRYPCKKKHRNWSKPHQRQIFF